MKILFFILFVCILATKPALAEIYNCEGKWTNRPCSGKVEGSIKEKAPSNAPIPGLVAGAPSSDTTGETSDESKFDMKRYELIRDLRRANEPQKTGNKRGIERSEVESVARLCSDQSHSNAECTEAYSAAMKKIESTKETAEDVLLGNTE